ncbi:IclR family transcriptional regulator [Shewanella sp. 1_MG-2023]|uniref:IclR family transcriptional regulator n=1 Tax=unclassified Shewanella TaxID=196818 RepID=UPI0026E27163|nr:MULTISPECIES: IclR family transcriptional regulator [unclassified Shewanella]MDO6612307.1 IclR family transcriptional regulator [Shewanella sp. 7_MG-2023]MDO6772161.1 IclR family transcriptional regulator [Shewanella sp. 2_MG-2023]MDO6794067.1 IclR family transcriptional regulator [Shewanella sp. 1_MG-2023]
MVYQQENKYAVPALDKALDVLEYLTEQSVPKSQAEIAKGLKRSANEIYRILIGLEARGYLIRDEKSGCYRISLKLYNLSHSISPVDQMRQCALPHMEDLAVQIGLSCHLSMLYQSKVMVIVQARSHTPVSLNITEGSIFPTSTTASGKVLLANSNEEVRDMILKRDQGFIQLASHEQTAFINELANIQKLSYIAGKSELTEGVYDFSTLIGKPLGSVVAALSVSSLNTQLGAKYSTEKIKHLVMNTAAQITKQLGC